jgi:hypothetical protein
MFGFEKPRWHNMPEFGALLDALDKARQTLPEARSQFLRGDLPPGGRLMVRYETADTDEFQWARVQSWEDSGHAVVRDIGRELASGVQRRGRPRPHNDTWVAACCLVDDLPLAKLNTKDFADFAEHEGPTLIGGEEP